MCRLNRGVQRLMNVVRVVALTLVAPILGCGASSSVGRPAGVEVDDSKTERLMRIGHDILTTADQLESASRAHITRGNALRRRIGQLRVRSGVPKTDEALGALVAEIEHWEGEGGRLRARSQSLRKAAQMLLIEAFDQRWTDWITNPSPLVMEATDEQVVAHNNQIRSVHPTVAGAAPSTEELPEKHRGMSIRVPRLTAQKPPETLNVSSFQVSRGRHFFAHVEVEPDASGRALSVPLNRIHKWRLIVSDITGHPIEEADIEVVGHMPGHVHGLPTQPAVTGQVAPGVYRVDGMKFQMNGWWVIQFNVKHGGLSDSVRYNLLL